MSQVLYGERSWNPLARTVELTGDQLRRGGRATPLGELNLGAMAEAFRRGSWLGGGGAHRSGVGHRRGVVVPGAGDDGRDRDGGQREQHGDPSGRVGGAVEYGQGR